MYINDIHILYYLGFGILGITVGQLIDWCNITLSEHKQVFSKDFFKIYLKNFKPKYMLIIITAYLYIGVLYFFGLNDVRTYEYLCLIPIIICAFCIDYKKQIIPNRLSLTLLEVGLFFAFIEGITNLNIAIDKAVGFVIGMLIMLLITLVGNLISKKESIGFGDVKLISVLGLFFGWKNIIAISAMSFLLAAIISIFLIILKKKKANEYIAFGPFIVISSIIIIFIPVETMVISLLSLGS